MELRDGAQREIALAGRRDAVRPGNASRSDVKHVLQVAETRFDELVDLWEDAHA